MKVAVFGAGYVGCVTASSLASLGHTVWLVESSKSKLASLKEAKCPIVEPGIDEILPKQIRQNHIIPSAQSDEAVKETELALICVGTPSLPDGTSDIRQVQAVLQEIAKALKTRHSSYVIALRSTTPYPLLANALLPKLEKEVGNRWGKEVAFALNPEFLREGSALKDFMNPPFVIVGTAHAAAAKSLRRLYKDVHAPFHHVSLGSASLLKYACNAYHASKIVFANEIAGFSSAFNADANKVMDIFCQDSILNVSSAYLRPGFAYGGSCLPKDLKMLCRLSAMGGIGTPFLESIEKSNALLIEKSVQILAGCGVRKIGLVGLTFKTGTDDFRNSPLVELAERLLGKGIELSIYDPDINLKQVHGQNLRFIEERMPHLAQAQKPNFRSLLQQSELLVIGKATKTLAADLKHVPKEMQILDLTRRLPLRDEKPTILRLEAMEKIPGYASL
jgi:GDP-mannose 6-dehydrogenase